MGTKRTEVGEQGGHDTLPESGARVSTGAMIGEPSWNALEDAKRTDFNGTNSAKQSKKRKRSEHTVPDIAEASKGSKPSKSGKSSRKDKPSSSGIEALAQDAPVATSSEEVSGAHPSRQAMIDKEAARVTSNAAPAASKPVRGLKGLPHDESIMAARRRGDNVELPGDANDTNRLRAQLIQSYEAGDQKRVKRLIEQAYPTIDPNALQNCDRTQTQKHPQKAVKYEREKAKRVAKRDARHWVEVRKNPHLYRPDGSSISAEKKGMDIEEVKAKRKAKKEQKQKKTAEKLAKGLSKQQKQLERRVAKKMKRAEKKQQNHIKMQAQISAKRKKQKQEADEAAAKDAGMSYDDFIAEKQRSAEERRIARHKAEANKLGMPYEEYLEQLKAGHDKKQGAATNPTTTEVGSTAADDVAASDSDSESETSSEDSDSYGSSIAEGDITNGPTNPAAAGDDFIPLGDTSASSANGGFVIDTVGNSSRILSSETTKKLKKMSKAERKVRLAEVRKRRAERKAASGASRLSQKERRKSRAHRKEEILSRMTNDLIAKKRKESNANDETMENGSGHAKDIRSERKQMRREARRIMRGVKKGKISEDQLMPGWELPSRKNKKPKQ